MKKKALMILSIFLILSCTACGAAAKSDSMKKEQSMGTSNNYVMSYGSEGADMDMAETSAKISEDTTTVQDGRKLIKEVDMSVETKHFDEFVSNLETEVQRIGGYLENASIGGVSYHSSDINRSAWFTARVPVESLDEFIYKIGENGNVTSISRNVRDITLEYVDVEGRIQTLESELERLNELLEQAASLEDILAIEAQISDVRYELESYQSQMNTYNNRIDYSTVSINVWEVAVISSNRNESIWDQIRSGFEDSLYGVVRMIQDGFIWIITTIPYWVVFGGIVFIFIKLMQRRRKKKEILRNLAMDCEPESIETEETGGNR